MLLHELKQVQFQKSFTLHMILLVIAEQCHWVWMEMLQLTLNVEKTAYSLSINPAFVLLNESNAQLGVKFWIIIQYG